MRGKLENHGRTCVFVGYADKHAGDVYRMLNLKTNKIIMSRDILWLNKTFGEYFEIKKTHMIVIDNDDEDDDEENRENENEEENENPQENLQESDDEGIPQGQDESNEEGPSGAGREPRPSST